MTIFFTTTFLIAYTIKFSHLKIFPIMKQFLIVINDKAIISYHSVTVKMFKMQAGLFDIPDT
jgi:hypothetical protein